MAVKIQAVSPELTVSSAKAVIGAAITASEPIKAFDKCRIALSLAIFNVTLRSWEWVLLCNEVVGVTFCAQSVDCRLTPKF